MQTGASTICTELLMKMKDLDKRLCRLPEPLCIRKESYPKDLNTKDDIAALPDMVRRGGSCIIDPYGR